MGNLKNYDWGFMIYEWDGHGRALTDTDKQRVEYIAEKQGKKGSPKQIPSLKYEYPNFRLKLGYSIVILSVFFGFMVVSGGTLQRSIATVDRNGRSQRSIATVDRNGRSQRSIA